MPAFLKLTKRMAFDTEATGLDVPYKDAPFAVSLVNETLDEWYCEWDVDPKTRRVTPNQKDVALIKRALSDPKREKIAYNAAFDISGVEWAGVPVPPPFHDAFIRCKRARSNEFSYELKKIAAKYLDIPADDEHDLQAATITARKIASRYHWRIATKETHGKDPVKADYWLPRMVCKLLPGEAHKLPADALTLCQKYCVLDAKRAMMLHLLLDEVIGEREQAGYEKEMRLLPIVLRMQKYGWRVHADRIASARQTLLDEVRNLKREINKWADTPITDWKDNEYRRLLYDELAQTSLSGKRSVDRAHLEAMEHEVSDLLLDMKDATGCIQKFLDPIMGYAVKEKQEYVVYPKYNQAGARTFRFSATRPPIQTIPDAAKTKSNMSVRQCLGPREGYEWYLIDYKALQVRIFASEAKEPNMLQGFKEGRDPHSVAAQLAWGGEGNHAGLKILSNTVSLPDYAEVLREWADNNKLLSVFERGDYWQIAEALLEMNDYDIVKAEASFGSGKARSIAKSAFFLVLFCGGAKKLAKGLRCTVQEARAFIQSYDRALPRMRVWMREVIKFAQKHGYIVTAYDTIIHTDPTFEYRAVNYDVQGTEAEFVKDRMIAVDAACQRTPFKLFGQIHDELALLCRKGEADMGVLKKLKTVMEDNTGHLCVETPCEVEKISTTWDERIKIKL